MQERLEDLLLRIKSGVESGEIDKRVISYTDYKSKYVVLKPMMKVRIELTDGKIFEIDISDYLEGLKQ